jgi:hypothetical protein
LYIDVGEVVGGQGLRKHMEFPGQTAQKRIIFSTLLKHQMDY